MMPGKLTSIKIIKQLLAERNFAPRKSLGQNFLIDENTLNKIVNAGSLGKKDTVLEVGPGLGALTEKLIESAGQVIAIEYDRGLAAILAENFTAVQNLLLLNQDILETDLKNLFKDSISEQYNYKVIANLPYYITTPVIFKLIESRIPWGLMVFLVQKEVADRLTAVPGTKEYGALTVMLSYFGKVEKIAVVPKTVFYPAPQVDSAIVRITFHQNLTSQEAVQHLRRVVQAAFHQRRKTILNALTTLDSLFISKESIAEQLRALHIDPSRRGETLSLEEFIRIATILHI
jgi:dimethyladenosine transferase